MKQASPGDVAALWREYKEEQSAEAKEAVVIHYLGLVRFIAGRMALNSPPQVEEDDLIGWGVLGLLDAVEKFDLDQGVKFDTYASKRIRGAIIDQIRSLDWAPRSLRRRAREMAQAQAKLKKQLARQPTEAELAAELGMTENDLFQLKADAYGAYILSLDSIVPGDDDTSETTLEQLTSNASSPSPEESASRKEAEQQLADAIERLALNERQVITLYYYDELTLKEIGLVLGLTESRICQIHREVIRKLRQHLKGSLRDAIH